jgi:hypothetical protein
MDVQVIGAFITDNRCRRALISRYLDSRGVIYGDIKAASYD